MVDRGRRVVRRGSERVRGSEEVRRERLSRGKTKQRAARGITNDPRERGVERKGLRKGKK